MPAVVKQHRRVVVGRDQRRGRQPPVAARSKKDRKCSRISSEVTRLIVAHSQPRGPRRGRPRSGRGRRRATGSRRRDLVARAARHGHRRGAVAQLDRVDLGRAGGAGAASRTRTVPVGQRRARRRPSRCWRVASVRSTYSGSPVPPQPEPAALADGEVVRGRGGGRARARPVDDRRPARSRRPPWRARNARAPGAGQEAEVLRVGLAGDRQPGLGGERAHLGLGQLAEREAQARERARGRARRACRPGPWPGRPRARSRPLAGSVRA